MSDLAILILSQIVITMMAVSAVNYHTTRMIRALAGGIDKGNTILNNEIRSIET